MRMNKVWIRQQFRDQCQKLALRKMNNAVKELKPIFCLAQIGLNPINRKYAGNYNRIHILFSL